jgi:MFS family permease
VSGVSAVLTAVLVGLLLPESRVTEPGRVDIGGALLLGTGLVGVVASISVGTENGWLRAAPLVLVGLAALTGWYTRARRVPEPIIDVRGLSRPVVLMLVVVVLAAGAYQSMLQLYSLISDVAPTQGLGYGVAADGALAMLHGVPPIGIVLGGTVAGALAARIGPAVTLAAGVAVGTVATVGLFVGVSSLPVAVVCSFLLSLTAGTVVTSGFNLAAALAPPERQGSVSSLVMTMIAVGSVLLNFVGAAVLRATRTTVDGTPVNTATGVFSYIGIGAGAFVIALVAAAILVRTLRRARGAAAGHAARTAAPVP